MPQFSPQQLQTWSCGQWLGGRLPVAAVTGFTQDSRALGEGMCFVALKTGRRDGHDFIAAAFAAGAAMALVATADEACPLPQLVVADPLRAFQQIARAYRLQFAGKVIGVTGSCGKTSTKNILQTLLGEHCHATAGNLNNFIGVPLTLLALEPTEHTCAVVEAGISEPGEMALLADMIRPDIAVVTMVGAAHLQDLGSIEGVAAEKVKLAAAQGATGGALSTEETLPTGVALGVGKDVTMPLTTSLHAVSLHDVSSTAVPSTAALPLLFAPLECWSYPAFAASANRGVAVAAFTANAVAAATAHLPSGVELYRYRLEHGATAFLYIEGEQLCERFALGFSPSDGMASNLALALLAAHMLGVPIDLLAQRVRNWQPQGNRGSWKIIGAQRFFVDCYNANPASMADSLAHFTVSLEAGESSACPRLYVIGGMRELGAESARWHGQLGEQLAALVNPARGDRVVLVGDAADNAACAAAIVALKPQAQVLSFTETAAAQSAVAAFKGIIFLKGSRYYALETLLPASASG